MFCYDNYNVLLVRPDKINKLNPVYVYVCVVNRLRAGFEII